MGEATAVLELAQRLAREAGAIQRERYETDFEIQTKSASIDLVTDVDHACEALIVEALQRERPADAILAEEGRGDDRADATWRWVIDPLDGTTNYAHGYPRFCVSIGIECDGERRVGVVYDPLLDELYAAVRGEGARLNGRQIRVSEETALDQALIATGFAYDVRRSLEDNLDHFAAVVKRARAIRRDGSAALDLCYVAAGRRRPLRRFLGAQAPPLGRGCRPADRRGGGRSHQRLSRRARAPLRAPGGGEQRRHPRSAARNPRLGSRHRAAAGLTPDHLVHEATTSRERPRSWLPRVGG
jgi:myo-inositol-1(or 4)-monophosphatase